MDKFWKKDWDETRRRITNWWNGKGFVISFFPPLQTDTPVEDITPPKNPRTLKQSWIDPIYRARKAEYELSRTFFGGDSFPYFDTHIGPGNLASFLGSEPEFAEDTVWYKHCISDPASHPVLEFNPDNYWFKVQIKIIEKGLEISRGRFLVGMPDLIQNMDTLASLRGTEQLMLDIYDRPDFVKERIWQINDVYCKVFEKIYGKIKDEWNGNAYSAFQIWGPGKTAVVQCDTSAMLSSTAFEEFVVPALTEQCNFLDYCMYHLDGSQGLHHLEHIRNIRELQAVEFTPEYTAPWGGDPKWYNLYQKILEGGKSIQAVFVKPEEVIPLIHAIGTEGVFVMVKEQDAGKALNLLEKLEKYR